MKNIIILTTKNIIMISIFIIDNHTLFREGLKEILKSLASVHIAGDSNKQDALPQKIWEARAEVVILGQMEIDNEAINLCDELTSEPYNLKVLIIGENKRHQNFIKLLNAGALGFVPKNASVEILKNSVEKVANGYHSFPKESAEALIPLIKRNKSTKIIKKQLSEREEEIVRYIAEGLRNKQIAELLNISHRTVEVHKAHIFKKLNTSNIADIIKFAMENNIYNLNNI